jgi:hypothetical protein
LIVSDFIEFLVAFQDICKLLFIELLMLLLGFFLCFLVASYCINFSELLDFVLMLDQSVIFDCIRTVVELVEKFEKFTVAVLNVG